MASKGRVFPAIAARRRFILAAALVPPVAYVLCVWHYAVNAPYQDDWSVTGVVSAALHGRLTLRELWTQHAEGRLPVPYLLFVASGWINHLNLKSIVVLDALLFVATYVLMLHMFRIYTKRPLTVLRVLSLGVVWFCIVGLDGALWAFLLTWYLALFFVFVVTYLLLVWPSNRTLAIALAVPIAILASFSWVQGFLVWPIGLMCLLWTWTADRRGYGEVAIWLSTGLATTLLYLRGYESGVGCFPVGTHCSIRANAGHPIRFAKFFLSLVANAVPLRVLNVRLALVQVGPGLMQLLGFAMCLASLFVIIRSIQERRATKLPLPLLLIVLALLFDLSIALGRANEGVLAALQGRFMMANLFLIVGLLTYAWSHLPQPRVALRQRDPQGLLALIVLLVLAILISFQAVVGTAYGIRVARRQRATQVQNARTAVNLDRIPEAERGCYVSVYVWNGVFAPNTALLIVRAALQRSRRDHLIVFAPATFRKYRAEGPPRAPTRCLSRYGVRPPS